MSRHVGIWIDYSECLISFPDEGQYIRRILSHAGLRLGLNADASQTTPPARDPRIDVRLDKYYMEIINCVHSADAIVVFGPDDAKGEFHERMLKAEMGDRVIAVEHMAKISTSQIVEKIAESFNNVPASVAK